MSVITASAKLLEPVLQLAQHYRMEPSQVFSSAQLSADEFTKPGSRFPALHFNDVLQALAQASNNPLIALTLGEATQPRLLGSIGFLMSTAPTLDKAYQTLVDYFPLLFEGAVLHMEQTLEGTLLTVEMNSPELQPIEYFLACLVNWPRSLTGQQVPVSFVSFTFSEPENPQDYQRFFAAEVEFDSASNQILLPSYYLAHNCLDANEEMHQLHREFADSLLSKSNQQSALIAQTRHLIRQQLNEGGGTVRRDQVAASVGLSLRTLQRKLGVLGTSFQDVYDHTRREVSLQLIQRGQLSFGEIAFQLGFSNQSAFQKAFKRWMGVAPSAYRQQINPVIFSSQVTSSAPKPTNTAWLESDSINDEIQHRIAALNGFSVELLEYAALLGDKFDLTELGEATNNPVARVAIHLWRAEQLGLIQPVLIPPLSKNAEVEDKAGFAFTHADIRSALYERMTERNQAQRHLCIGEAMLNTLSLPFLLEQISPVLFHLNQGARLTVQAGMESNTIPNNLVALNIQAASLAEAQQDYLGADGFLQHAKHLLSDAESVNSAPLLLQRTRLLLLGGKIESAQKTLQELSSNINLEETINAALMQAQIYQHNGLHSESLTHLLNIMLLLEEPLPPDEVQQLSLLLTQLYEISERFDAVFMASMPEIYDQKHLLRLQLLEQVSLLARHLGLPLLAACAISRMTLLSIQYGRSPFTAFAFVSYAWVASWFCADYALAQTFSAQGMHLANQYGQAGCLPGSEKVDQKDVSLNAVLLQSSQVLHWFTPLETAISQLLSVDEQATTHNQWLIQSDCRLLRHQLLFFSAMPLSEQLVRCQDNHNTMINQGQTFKATYLGESTQLLLEQLCSEKAFPATVKYKHGWQAVSTIIGALLLDRQSIWPELYSWEALLENELAGYFCVTEALFCTAMMRLIQSQQQHTLGRRRRVEIEQIESRMELWARRCPDNFKGQWLLLQAEKARLVKQDSSDENSKKEAPAVLFEKAIKATEAHEFGYHKALCYERYADYLYAQEQTRLARFCLNEACYLYQCWGAVEKVKQLRQTHALLAI
ncbi:AraC family transcriptional regulator [Neptunomonas japonica]|uniref:AraC family transcriptional regulator n=1 Tax=Neptunomonas japonica TaxID=417574 RepID=UPI0003F644FE|nr:AraC family transcriptional regulator ligand-binding domain-containing protein [Neptunomonas japonica]